MVHIAYDQLIAFVILMGTITTQAPHGTVLVRDVGVGIITLSAGLYAVLLSFTVLPRTLEF